MSSLGSFLIVLRVYMLALVLYVLFMLEESSIYACSPKQTSVNSLFEGVYRSEALSLMVAAKSINEVTKFTL